MKTVVLQSYRTRDVPSWVAACLASVERWATVRGYGYHFLGDELFDKVPPWYRRKTAGRLPIVADFGRLAWLREVLEEGEVERALWLDADVLVFDPALELDFEGTCAFGQEWWVEEADGGARRGFEDSSFARGPAREAVRVRRNVHNAVCGFKRDCPVLPFLMHTVLSLIRRVEPDRIAPQMVGPKLLGALHSLADFPLLPQVGAFSPLVMRDLANGDGPALALLKAKSPVRPQAANLCASLADDEVAERVVARLLERGLG